MSRAHQNPQITAELTKLINLIKDANPAQIAELQGSITKIVVEVDSGFYDPRLIILFNILVTKTGFQYVLPDVAATALRLFTQNPKILPEVLQNKDFVDSVTNLLIQSSQLQPINTVLSTHALAAVSQLSANPQILQIFAQRPDLVAVVTNLLIQSSQLQPINIVLSSAALLTISRLLNPQIIQNLGGNKDFIDAITKLLSEEQQIIKNPRCLLSCTFFAESLLINSATNLSSNTNLVQIALSATYSLLLSSQQLLPVFLRNPNFLNSVVNSFFYSIQDPILNEELCAESLFVISRLLSNPQVLQNFAKNHDLVNSVANLFSSGVKNELVSLRLCSRSLTVIARLSANPQVLQNFTQNHALVNSVVNLLAKSMNRNPVDQGLCGVCFLVISRFSTNLVALQQLAENRDFLNIISKLSFNQALINTLLTNNLASAFANLLINSSKLNPPSPNLSGPILSVIFNLSQHKEILTSLGHNPDFVNATTELLIYSATIDPVHQNFSAIALAVISSLLKNQEAAAIIIQKEDFTNVAVDLLVKSSQLQPINPDFSSHALAVFSNLLQRPEAFENIASRENFVNATRDLLIFSSQPESANIRLFRVAFGVIAKLSTDSRLLQDFAKDEQLLDAISKVPSDLCLENNPAADLLLGLARFKESEQTKPAMAAAILQARSGDEYYYNEALFVALNDFGVVLSPNNQRLLAELQQCDEVMLRTEAGVTKEKTKAKVEEFAQQKLEAFVSGVQVQSAAQLAASRQVSANMSSPS